MMDCYCFHPFTASMILIPHLLDMQNIFLNRIELTVNVNTLFHGDGQA